MRIESSVAVSRSLVVVAALLAPACGTNRDAAPSQSVAATPVVDPPDAAGVALDDQTVPSTPVASPTDAADASPCPPEMAIVGSACIDRYEAHLVVPGASGSTRVLAHNERPPADVPYLARSAGDEFPQAYISRVESSAACARAGKRLCSFAEWERACQGHRGQLYPYGGRYRAGRCNSGKPHLLAQLFGSNAQRWKYDENFNDPELDELPGFLAKAGSFPDCVSEVGVFDLVGNLHEWVSDRVDHRFMERMDGDHVDRRKQSWRVGNGVFVGGFFSTIRELGPGCRFITVAHEPTYHDYSTGFRCCADATRTSDARLHASE